MRRLRFALLHDGESLERWHLGCLDELAEVADLAGVMVSPATTHTPQAGSAVMRRYAERARRRARVSGTDRLAEVARVELGTPGYDFVLSRGLPSPPEAADEVWFFEHEARPGFLPFFREVYEGEDVTHAALLSSAGAALEEGWFKTERRSYEANRNRVEH